MNYFLDFEYRGKKTKKPRRPKPLLWAAIGAAVVLFIAWVWLGNVLLKRVQATEELTHYDAVVVMEEPEPIYANYSKKFVTKGIRVVALKTQFNAEGELETIEDPDCVGLSDYLTIPPSEPRKAELPVTAVLPMSESMMLSAASLPSLGYSELLFLVEAGTLKEETTLTICMLLYNLRRAGVNVPIGLGLYPSVFRDGASAKYLETLGEQADFLALRARSVQPGELTSFLDSMDVDIDFYTLRILIRSDCEALMRLTDRRDWQIVLG